MKRITLTSIMLVGLVVCCSRPMQRGAGVVDESAQSAYATNSARANRIVHECQEGLHGKTGVEFVAVAKLRLDEACTLNLRRMEDLLHVWEFAITKSSYMGGSDPSAELTAYAIEEHGKGTDLLLDATDECVTGIMQVVRDDQDTLNAGHDVLDEYYTLYAKMHELAMHPQGSLIAYRHAINDFRLKIVKMSSQLAALTQ